MSIRTKHVGTSRQIEAFSDLVDHLIKNWSEDTLCKVLQTAIDFGHEYGAAQGYRSFLAHITEYEGKTTRGRVTVYFRDGIGKVCEVVHHPLASK